MLHPRRPFSRRSPAACPRRSVLRPPVTRPWRPAPGLTTALAVPLVLAASAVAVTPGSAVAAVACRVDYSVTSQWSGGFVASVNLTNLGDARTSWNLGWTFTNGETVTSAWNATVTQSGSAVTAASASWNGSLGTGASVSFGFQGAAAGTPGTPGSFALDGTACSGATGTTTPPATTSTTGTTTRSTTTTTATRASTTTRSTTTTTRTSTTTAGTPPASYPGPGVVTGSTGVHDPGIVKTPSGTYVMIGTGNGLPITTSTDRTAWRGAGTVWPSGASWTTAYTGGSASLWAPDISYHNGKYYLYYAASSFGSNTSAIFLATSSTAASGSWSNQGLVISTKSSDNYNAIDPNLVVDDAGRWWLTLGSFWSGIKTVALDPNTGLRSTSDTTVRSVAARSTAGGAIEAGFVFHHGGYYYLYTSWDLCCQGASSTYRIMVGRSTSATGPYTDRNGTALTSGGGTQVLAGHGSVHGPGGQSVLADSDSDVLVYHYYADNGNPLLGINLIGYDSAGWPYVY